MGQNTADDQGRGDIYYLFASDPKYRFDDSRGIPPDLGGVICRAEDKATADFLVELHAERYPNSGLGLVARPASSFSSRAYIDLAAHLSRLEAIVCNLGSEYHPCDDQIEAMAICAKRLSELEELIAAGGKLVASDKSVADQGTPETEYFLSLVLRAPDTDPREVITFYSLRDSNDARLASRLTRLFTMKYKSNNPDTLPWDQPEFDYRTAAGLDSDTVFMKRDDIARFSEPNTSYPKNAENYFRKIISYTSVTDRYAIGSFCHQQAVVWEKMLRDEAPPFQSQDPRKADDSAPPGKVLPNGASMTTPGPPAPLPARPEARFRPEATSKQDSATDDGMEAQQAEYFLWLTFLDPFEEICFYSLKDSNDARLVSRLCKLFTMKFWDCDPNMPEYKQPHFDYKAVHELDPDSVFLIREDINRFRKHGAWDLDVNLPHDEESLGSFCFQQAAVWEKALRAEAERPRGETSPEKGDYEPWVVPDRLSSKQDDAAVVATSLSPNASRDETAERKRRFGLRDPADRMLFTEDLPEPEAGVTASLFNLAESLNTFAEVLCRDLPTGHLTDHRHEEVYDYWEELEHSRSLVKETTNRLFAYPRLTPAHADKLAERFDKLVEKAKEYPAQLDGLWLKAQRAITRHRKAYVETISEDLSVLEQEIQAQGGWDGGVLRLQLPGAASEPQTATDYAHEIRAAWRGASIEAQHCQTKLRVAVLDLIELLVELNNTIVSPFLSQSGRSQGPKPPTAVLDLRELSDGFHWFVDGEDKGVVATTEGRIIYKISRILFDQIGLGWTPHRTFYQKVGWTEAEYFGDSGTPGRMQKQLTILRKQLGVNIEFRKERGVRFPANVVKPK